MYMVKYKGKQGNDYHKLRVMVTFGARNVR